MIDNTEVSDVSSMELIPLLNNGVKRYATHRMWFRRYQYLIRYNTYQCVISHSATGDRWAASSVWKLCATGLRQSACSAAAHPPGPRAALRADSHAAAVV